MFKYPKLDESIPNLCWEDEKLYRFYSNKYRFNKTYLSPFTPLKLITPVTSKDPLKEDEELK